MELSAKLTSKGQITLPKAVREMLDLNTGDRVLFRVADGSAVLAKTQDFLELARSVEAPTNKRGVPWDAVRSSTRRAWAEARR